MRELGAEAATADAFDPEAVRNAVEAAAPDVVIDQLTWLPASPADVLESLPNDTVCDARRRQPPAAARAVGVRRYVLQSRGFYLDAPAGRLADETAKLRYDAPGEIGESTCVLGACEERVLADADARWCRLALRLLHRSGHLVRPDGAVAEQLRNRESAILG